MYCQYCGKPVDDAALFCVNCGKQRVGPTPAAVSESPTQKLASHLRVLAVLWLIYSVFRIISGAWTLVFSHYLLPIISSFVNSNEDAQQFVGPMVGMMHAFYGFSFAYSLAAGIAGIVTAWGLFQRESWGRILAIMVAVGSVISIPFGTALAIYTLIVLLASGAERNYQQLASHA